MDILPDDVKLDIENQVIDERNTMSIDRKKAQELILDVPPALIDLKPVIDVIALKPVKIWTILGSIGFAIIVALGSNYIIKRIIQPPVIE